MIDPIEIRPAAKAATFKTIRVIDGGRRQVVLRLVDEHGQPVQLDKEPENAPAEKPKFGIQTSVGRGTAGIKLIVVGGVFNRGGTTGTGLNGVNNEAGDVGGPVFEKVGRMLSEEETKDCADCAGLIEFIFETDDQIGNGPGIYACQIERYVTGGYLVDAWPAYLMVEPNLRKSWCYSGPPSIAEIRLALGDSEINEVSLLDNFEFTDTEIVFALRQVVDHWNNTPPPVTTYGYDSVPFRYWWIRGAIIELLKIAARRYARNRLQYSAGGVQIDDQNKANDYLGMAADLKKEYDDWFIKTKVGQNMSRAWGSNPAGSFFRSR